MTSTVLVYYLMLPPPSPPYVPPDIPSEPLITTPLAYIEINGDAKFSTTALLEGWPGDGSPENPYIIDGLEIDLGGENSHGIVIRNTRASFTISNCNFTGAGASSSWNSRLEVAGILLENVTHAELVNNICSSNDEFGISLRFSNSNTITGNTANNNWAGIRLTESSNNNISGNTALYNGINGIWVTNGNSNTIAANLLNDNEQGITLAGHNNIITGNIANNNHDDGIGIDDGTNNIISGNTACYNIDYGLGLHGGSNNIITENTANNNDQEGIFLTQSDSNIISSNTIHNNRIGISLEESEYNIVENNTCNSNDVGIYLLDSYSNIVVNNTYLNNTQDILKEFQRRDYDPEDPEVPEVPEVLLLIESVVYIGLIVVTLLGGMWIVHKRVSKEGN
ncbi:MAG: nitrous oxide reductase family maturation protein NosD [Promethearchaeota archaeon]